ncbi:MAG: phospholipase [Methanomicrobiaceae archaeon]|nr:phospholipase [Methanomicrobiaceae archaeon]
MKEQKTFCSILLVFVLIIFLASSVQAFQITSFCPDTWVKGEGDEFFIISGDGSLSGLMVTDGEGSLKFPEGSFCRGSVTVAREGRIYTEIHKTPPDYEIYDTDPDIPDAIRSGNFQMGNSGDEITLTLNKKTIQEIVWPGDFKKGEGRVHVLKDGVWDIRPYYIGQSDFEPETFYDVSLTAFISPDCSYEVFEDAVSDADSKIKLNVYEFTSPEISGMLSVKAAGGVSLEVLLEGGPVGGISSSEYYAASEIIDAGASVYSVETENGHFHSPYRYDHAKYMTIDGENVLLASENFGRTGFPPAGTSGNRGYGVYIRDASVASYFDNIFETDIKGGWVAPFSKKAGSPEESLGSSFSRVFEPATFTGVSVTPVVSPDTSCLIEDMISSAEYSVDIEQAYIKNWSSGENPYLNAAISAAERGADVRILLDSYWYNTEGEDDNDEMADYINAVAQSKNLSLRAGLADLNSLGVEKIHNKAVITDGKSVLISSVNWNENSPCYNREAGVILSGGGVAAYYSDVFEYDWERRQGCGATGSMEVLSDDGGYFLKCMIGLFVIALFAGIYAKRRM